MDGRRSVLFGEPGHGGGPSAADVAVLVGAARLAQTDGTSSQPDDKRQQAADLLRRARQAMRENDLPTADMLISQADSLKVEYSPITMEDTPRKARQALEQIRNADSWTAGRIAPGGRSRGRPRPSDPFYGRIGRRHAGPSHACAADRGRSRCRRPARGKPCPAAPANGHRATTSCVCRGVPWPWATSAAPSTCSTRPSDSTSGTDRWTTAPRRSKRPSASTRRPSSLDRNTEAGRRAYARMLMEQAEALLHYGAIRRGGGAGRPCRPATESVYPYEARPQDLLAKIGAARRQGDTLIRPLPPPADGGRCADRQPGGVAIGRRRAAPGVVSPAVYNPSQDPTRNVQAATVQAASPVVASSLA